VEILLLNGCDFFTKDNQLLLDNLGAYTVKDIAVYERQGEDSKFVGRNMGYNDYVMDVRLKKEYQHGWVVNAKAGGETSDRYMARILGLHYTPHSQFGVFGNMNNLNDKHKPGRNSLWSQENATQGDFLERQAGIDYNVDINGGKTEVKGNVTYAHTTENRDITTERTNLLSGGKTYDYQYNAAKNKMWQLRQMNSILVKEKNIMIPFTDNLSYTKYENTNSYAAATFDSEKQSMNRDIINEIYLSAYVGQSDGLLNRSLQNVINDGHRFNAPIDLSNNWKFTKNSDLFTYGMTGIYSEDKSDNFKDYTINYGNEASPAYKTNEYYSRSNRNLGLKAHVGYIYYANDDWYI